jgi:limonene-1,2-epoxide hydrolase
MTRDTTAHRSAAIGVVEDFLMALEQFDTERAIALLHPEVEYQNVPFPPARGRQAVARQLQGFDRYFTGFEARTHHIAAEGDVVLTERTDVLELGRLRASFWVCGTFELEDGLIRVWRDRFDFADISIGFLRGAVRALLPRR